MEIFKLLENDHAKVAGLFAKIEKTQDATQREKLFDELAMELTIHTTVEERIVYSRLYEEDEMHEDVAEAREEHRHVSMLLKDMAELSPDSEDWTAKCTVLKEMVEHHVEEEETEMFPKARQLLSKDDTQEMAQTFEGEKEALLEGLSQDERAWMSQLGL